MDVLVLEFRQLIRDVYLRGLAEAGLTAHGAASVGEAHRAIHRHGPPRVLVTETMLAEHDEDPVAFGLTVLAKAPGAMVIYATGGDEPRHRLGPRERLLRKPVRPERLAALVRDAMQTA